mmetsp:Transcript_87481/g.260975  ORF Transcript_87481/g.260975 Transcript_87481/m.260975 type:complete len:295 (-) Transcript_87481:7-891(-)
MLEALETQVVDGNCRVEQQHEVWHAGELVTAVHSWVLLDVLHRQVHPYEAAKAGAHEADLVWIQPELSCPGTHEGDSPLRIFERSFGGILNGHAVLEDKRADAHAVQPLRRRDALGLPGQVDAAAAGRDDHGRVQAVGLRPVDDEGDHLGVPDVVDVVPRGQPAGGTPRAYAVLAGRLDEDLGMVRGGAGVEGRQPLPGGLHHGAHPRRVPGEETPGPAAASVVLEVGGHGHVGAGDERRLAAAAQAHGAHRRGCCQHEEAQRGGCDRLHRLRGAGPPRSSIGLREIGHGRLHP